MIKKVANNETNQEELYLEPTEKITEKLNYYRSLIPKLPSLNDQEIADLQTDISTFFNIKPVRFNSTLPEYLFRISSNNRILGEENLGFLTNVSQLLAPPVQLCNYNRCNLPKQQVLYCATDELTAYWETKPKKGDVITISLFEAKPEATLNTAVLDKEKSNDKNYSHQLLEAFHVLNDFFVEVFTMPVDRDNPKGYLFSAALSSEQLFYPIESDKNIEAIAYPSVQRKMNGYNVALRNDILFKKYDLVNVTTRWIIEEIENIEPSSDERIIDDLISSIIIKEFDIENDRIIYPDGILDKFVFFRYLQNVPGKQERFKEPMDAEKFMKLAPLRYPKKPPVKEKKIGRNERVTVMYYNNGPVKKNIKYKLVEEDIKQGRCMLL
jgi:hypothetical protein